MKKGNRKSRERKKGRAGEPARARRAERVVRGPALPRIAKIAAEDTESVVGRRGFLILDETASSFVPHPAYETFQSALAAIPHLGKSPQTALLYLYLVSRAYSQGGNFVQVSQLELGRDLAMWPSTIRFAKSRLERLGLVHTLGHGGRKAETYRVYLPSDVAGPWGVVRLKEPALPAPVRVCNDPVSKLDDAGREVLRLVKAGLSPAEMAKVRARALGRLRTQKGNLRAGGPVGEDEIENAVDELVLLERVGRDRLKEFGVVF